MYVQFFGLYLLQYVKTAFQDSTIDFEKRRNVPVRYNRELIQTTVKAMKRIGEIRAKRERAFFKNRYAQSTLFKTMFSILNNFSSMAVSRAKHKEHRKKMLEAAKSSSLKLQTPVEATVEPIREKIKVGVKSRSALVPGEGRSMGMDID